MGKGKKKREVNQVAAPFRT